MLVRRKAHFLLKSHKAFLIVRKQRDGRVVLQDIENSAKGVQPLSRAGKISVDQILLKYVDVVLFQNKLVTLIGYALGKGRFFIAGNVKDNALYVGSAVFNVDHRSFVVQPDQGSVLGACAVFHIYGLAVFHLLAHGA